MATENLQEVFTRFGDIVCVIDIENLALRADRDPTTGDLSKEGRLWINRSSSKIFILTDVSGVPAEANWKEIADATPDGLDGQLLIGKTGLPATWGSLGTDGSIAITEGVGTISLAVVGATAASFVTDAGNATPVLGVTQFAGGTNLASTGAGNLVTFNLAASPSVAGSLTAATTIAAGTSVTAGDSLTMSAGTCTITSDDNAGQDIYLHADGGVAETIEIHADQSTVNASIYTHSDLGGIKSASGLASALALVFDASDAAGGITTTYGTSGYGIKIGRASCRERV